MGGLNFFKRNSSSKEDLQDTVQQDKYFQAPLENEEIIIDPVLKKKLDCDLLPGEIILLDWMKGKSANANSPQYFQYIYGIDVGSSINKLVEKGLLTLQSPKDSLSSLKVTDLKEILKEHGLKSTGNKSVLVDMLKDKLSDEQIEQRIPDKIYSTSLEGKSILSEYSYIIWAKQNDSKDGTVNVASVIMEMKKTGFKESPQEIAWKLLAKAYAQNIRNKNYGLARNVHSNMARHLQKENKSYQALYHYIKVTQFDMSGLNNGDYISHPKYMMVTSGIFDRINRIIFELDLSEQRLKMLFIQVWNETIEDLPFHYLDKVTAFSCFQAAREDDVEYIKNVLLSSYRSQPENIKRKVINID